MGASGAIRDAYYALEDKWYGFVDAVSEKVPVFGKLIDGLEDRGIPTLPAMILLITIVLVLLYFFSISPQASSLTVLVEDLEGNSIPGATVALLQNDETKAEFETNENGEATFFVPNGDYSIRVSKRGYPTNTLVINLLGNATKSITLEKTAGNVTKTVYLKSSEGALVVGSGTLLYKCKDTNEEAREAGYSDGKFDASVSESCAEVEIISIQKFNLINPIASFAGNSSVIVEKQEAVFGMVSVLLNVADSNQNAAPAGLRVRLVPNDGTLPIEALTTTTNVVLFEEVPIKSYYVLVSDPRGEFLTYDGSKIGDLKEVKRSELIQFNVLLVKGASSKIKVTVKDSRDNSLIRGAEVKITSVVNSNEVQKQVTPSTGVVEFSVSQGTNYVVTVDHPDYVVGTTKPVSAGDVIDFLITKATEENSNSILVKVVDRDKNPVEKARVVLKKLEATEQVVGEKITGSNGEAEFFNLELGKTYLANISKEGFGMVNSASIQAEPRAQKVLTVTFDIGKGRIVLKVMDSENNLLSGAVVTPIDYYTSRQDANTPPITTSVDGIAEFNVRADKKVYFLVEYAGLQKYFTAPIDPIANATRGKTIVMQKPSSKFLILPLEVYNGKEIIPANEANNSGVVGGSYTVRAIIQVPKGVYSEAGIHLRTGKQTMGVTNSIEEDGLYLTSAESSGKIVKGTTFTPPNGYSTDSKNLTNSNAKWINSIWKNPQEGTYELEAQIRVEETNPLVPIDLYYRGWAKGGSMLRDPASSPQNELYADAKNRKLVTGTSNLCGQSFCKSYVLKVLSGADAGREKYVLGTMEIKKGVEYALDADLTNFSGKAISSAVLSIEGKGIDIIGVHVNGVEQSEKTVQLGTIGIDMPLKTRVVFTANASGSSALKFTITSSTKTELEEVITLNVKANKRFNFSMVPKVVIPYINNELYFEAIDANKPLEGVVVKIKSGNDLLGTVETTGEGLARYVLAEPRIGEQLTITAMKEGYDSFEVTKKIDAGLLTITPPQIYETIKIGDITAVNLEFIMQNNTSKNIKIVSAKINSDLSIYLDATFPQNINNTIIESGKDRNYSVLFKLTNLAKRLREPKDIFGTILIESEVSGASQSFVNEIPVSIRLSMPGYIDNIKCLKANPATINLFASDSEQSATITITNACTAEGTKISLKDVEARLSEALKIGTISVSGQGFLNAQISDKAVKITDFIDEGAEVPLTIKFSPNVAMPSASQTVNLFIVGKNILNDKSFEKAESVIKFDLTMNNYAKCIEVQKPAGGVLLDMAPWNLGYARLIRSDYFPHLNRYKGFANISAPYNMPYLGGMGMTGYRMAGYGVGYNGFSGMREMSFQQNSFTVKNNCAVDVEVDLDPDPRVSVSEEKFVIEKDSDKTVMVEPGYVLGKYKIKVNAKQAGSNETKKKIDEVSVTIRRLGDIDRDCIKTNVTHISLNSFVYRPQKYSVYNYCYDMGVQLSRSNVATIECSAPRLAGGSYGVPYFQQGFEPYYAQQYPLVGSYGTYHNYIQANGCQANDCSLIAGTRVRYRTIEDGAMGSIERVDFDVMPSAQYVPQRRLFDNKRGAFGLFQNVSEVRQWATETDARTNVYGNLNINYTNQYGSSECMEFPITISDVWRLGESIDSAINWGDPQAKPRDCQEKDALNIVRYWKERTGSPTGVVPEDQFIGDTKDKYIYIAEPPALRIGPMPSQLSSAYPTYNYQYFINQRNNPYSESSQNASKNCGLLDGIEVKTVISQQEAGGAIITITDRPTGSLITNSRGSNLMVEVDRSGMTADCVYLTKPIVAKVTRAITLESQELVWNLEVLFTRKGYTYQGNPSECKIVSGDIKANCEATLKEMLKQRGVMKTGNAGIQKVIDSLVKESPECGKYLSVQIAQRMIDEIDLATQAGKECINKPSDYGFDKVQKTKLESLVASGIVDCTKYFCNGEMLQAFLLNKFNTIKEEINNVKRSSGGAKISLTGEPLSRLYREALGPEVDSCGTKLKYYKREDGSLAIYGDYVVPAGLVPTNAQQSITNIDNTATLNDVIGVLNKVLSQEGDAILVELDDNSIHESTFDALKMAKIIVGIKAKRYMPLKAYLELIKAMAIEESKNSDCREGGKDCQINFCQNKVTLTNKAFEYLASQSNARLIKGIPDKTLTDKEIEKIYSVNPVLNIIHTLAKYNTNLSKEGANVGLKTSLLLTNIPDTSKRPQETLFDVGSQAIRDLRLNFNLEKTEIGAYPVEIDYIYSDVDAKEANIIIGSKMNLSDAPKAMSNVLLMTGFDTEEVSRGAILQNSINGTIIEYKDNKALFYKRIPVKLTVDLYGQETGFNYSPVDQSISRPRNLINWYTNDSQSKGVDKLVGTGYTFSVTQQPTPQTIKGIYYYPSFGELELRRGNSGGVLVANTVAWKTLRESVNIPKKDEALSVLSITNLDPTKFTLDDLLEEIKAQRACPIDQGIVWNEQKLIQ